MKTLSEQEIINGLINRDSVITKQFFYSHCRNLFVSVINDVFPFRVDYDEIIDDLYYELMRDDARKLRLFSYRSTLMQWLKVVMLRHCLFLKASVQHTDDLEQMTLRQEENLCPPEEENMCMDDLNALFAAMPNKRYEFVLRKLLIEEVPPEHLAIEMGVTVSNLYNIKRRAMKALIKTVANDKRLYRKR